MAKLAKSGGPEWRAPQRSVERTAVPVALHSASRRTERGQARPRKAVGNSSLLGTTPPGHCGLVLAWAPVSASPTLVSRRIRFALRTGTAIYLLDEGAGHFGAELSVIAKQGAQGGWNDFCDYLAARPLTLAAQPVPARTHDAKRQQLREAA